MNDIPNCDTFASERINPYAYTSLHLEEPSDGRQLKIPAAITIVCCSVSLGFWLLAFVVSLPDGQGNAPPLIEILIVAGMFMIAPALSLAGAVSMLQRKRYALSVTGALCMLVPMIGPCFGLTLPVGVWSLVLLRRESIRNAFAKSNPPGEQVQENADDALAAASRLDQRGDWDGAMTLYSSIALRWPEHAAYIANCMQEIEKKQSAAR